MNDDQMTTAVARLHPQPIFKAWQWVVGWIVVAIIITTFVFTGIQVWQQREDSLKANSVECARQIASDYEDHRDAILIALLEPGKFDAAVRAFAAFETHDGKFETRAARTTRLCPS